MSEHVLVTGGAGFIGRFVVQELLARGHKVRVLDSLIEQVHGDLSDPEAVGRQGESRARADIEAGLLQLQTFAKAPPETAAEAARAERLKSRLATLPGSGIVYCASRQATETLKEITEEELGEEVAAKVADLQLGDRHGRAAARRHDKDLLARRRRRDHRLGR